MKKLFTLIAICFAFVAVNAQVLHENFDNGIPSSWMTLDANSTGYPWESMSQSLASVANCPYTADQFAYNETGDCVVSWSYYPVEYTGSGFSGTSLNQNNYLISPAFTPDATSVLSFYCMSFNGTNYPDDIAVKLSTGGTSASDFSVTLFPLTVVSWSEWTEKTVNLAAYAGQNVRIAFVHQSNNMFGLLLDEVTVSGGVGIANNENTTFTIFPNPATTSIKVTGEGEAVISNILGQTVTSATVNGSEEINVSNLESGVYFINMNGVSKKFIKK
ncbi:MAG: choice-of-anchor J domain-containing protein [Bacteroidales bacterium]|nr:choice-of-anchor J domain-containing protein [Bacteroidales bacterium]